MTEQRIIVPLHKPDLKEKIFYLLSGLLVSVPMTLFFYEFLNSFLIAIPPLYTQLYALVIAAPIIEEFSKVFPLYYRHGETERSFLTLGILIGLGFGITEFLFYVFLQGVLEISRVPVIIFHSCTALIGSYGVAKRRVIFFLVIAIALHSANNFFALASNIWFVSIPATANFLATYLIAYYLYRQTSDMVVK